MRWYSNFVFTHVRISGRFFLLLAHVFRLRRYAPRVLRVSNRMSSGKKYERILFAVSIDSPKWLAFSAKPCNDQLDGACVLHAVCLSRHTIDDTTSCYGSSDKTICSRTLCADGIWLGRKPRVWSNTSGAGWITFFWATIVGEKPIITSSLSSKRLNSQGRVLHP